MGVNGLIRRKEELIKIINEVEKTINNNSSLDQNNVLSNISKRAEKQLRGINRSIKIKRCEELISRLEFKKSIVTDDGNRVELSSEIRDAFMDELVLLSQSGGNSFTYYYDEYDDYMEGESLYLNSDNEIELVHGKRNNGPIEYTHFKSLDGMLGQYIKTYTRDAKDNDYSLVKIRG